MTTSTNNPVLTQLRETAETLGKPQSVVAAHWTRAGLTGKRYSPARHIGITRAQYDEGQAIITRLAACTN